MLYCTINKKELKGHESLEQIYHFGYKANQNGYEGLSEYLVSVLLSCSNVRDRIKFVKLKSIKKSKKADSKIRISLIFF